MNFNKDQWYEIQSKDKGPWRINVYEIRRGYIPCNSLEEADRVFLEVQDPINQIQDRHVKRIIYRDTQRTFGPRVQGTLRTNLFMTNLTNEELTCLIELVEMEHLISLCETNTEFFCNLTLKLKHIQKNHDIQEHQKLETHNILPHLK